MVLNVEAAAGKMVMFIAGCELPGWVEDYRLVKVDEVSPSGAARHGYFFSPQQTARAAAPA
jgi:hypothetical protein